MLESTGLMNGMNSSGNNTSVTSRERIRLKCRYEGDIRTVIIYPHSSFQDLKKRLSGDFGFDVSLKYEDHEGDLITLSSQNDLNDLFLYENTDTINVVVSESVVLPQLTLKTVGKQNSGSNLLQIPTIGSKDWSRGNNSGLGTPSQSMILPRFTPTNRFPSINDRFTEATGIRWKKGEMLGQGAFGVVYLGLNIDTGELMAVKQMATEEVSKRELSSLENEINLLRNLRHPNIVRYIGTELTASALSIFLEYVPGGSLKALIDKFGSLEESVAKSYTRQLLLGLEYLHRNGIAHRDIKGANCLVGNDGVIKLADFGNSKHWHPVANTAGAAMNATQTGDLKGTPAWMAPEVVKEQGNISWRKADIWSLACTTLEMTTGKPPWSQFNNSVTILYHLACQDTKPEYPYPASTELLTFLNICFQRDPSHRPDVTSLLLHPFVNGSSGGGNGGNPGWGVRPTTMSSLMNNDWDVSSSSSAFRSSMHSSSLLRRPFDMPANVRQVSTDSQQSASSFPNISNSRSNSVVTIPLLNVPAEPSGNVGDAMTANTGRTRLYSISSNPEQQEPRPPAPNDSITPRVVEAMGARDFNTPRTQMQQQQRLLHQYEMAAAHNNATHISNSLSIHVDPEVTHEAANVPSPVDHNYLSDYTAPAERERELLIADPVAPVPLSLQLITRDQDELGPPMNTLEPLIPLPNELSAASTPAKSASNRKKVNKKSAVTRKSISKSEKRPSVSGTATTNSATPVMSDMEQSAPAALSALTSPAKIRSAKGLAKKGQNSNSTLELNAIMNHARQKASTPSASELPADDSGSQVSNTRLKLKPNTYYDSEDVASDWQGNDGDNESLGDIEDEVGGLTPALGKDVGDVYANEVMQHIPEEEEAIRYHNMAMESPRNMIKTAIPYRHEDSAVDDAMYNRVTTADGIITWDEYLQHHPRHHVEKANHSHHHHHPHHPHHPNHSIHHSPPDLKMISSSNSPSKTIDESGVVPEANLQSQKRGKDLRVGGESLSLARVSRKGNKDKSSNGDPPSPVNQKKGRSNRREKREDKAADNDVLDISCDSLESLQIAGVHMIGTSGPRTFSRNNDVSTAPSAPSTSYGNKKHAGSFPDPYEDAGVYIVNDDSTLEPRRQEEPVKSLATIEPMMLEEHTGSVTRLRAPKKTDLLISSSLDGTLRIWGANDATSKVVLDASAFNNLAVRESVDNRPERRVTLGSKNPNIDLEGSNDLSDLVLPGRNVKVTNIWSEENCDSIWAACSDGSVRVWNGGEYKPLRLLKGHEEAITCIEGLDAYTYAQSTSTVVATGSVDRTIRTWDLRAKKTQVFVFRGHGDNVMTLRWCEGGRALISGGKDKTIKIWDTRAGRLRTTIEKHFGSVHALRVLSDVESVSLNTKGGESAAFVSAGRDSMINFWSASGDCLSSHSAHRGHVSYLSEINFSMTRRPVSATYASPLMLSCGSDNVIKLWDMRKSKCVADITANVNNNLVTGNISKMVWCGNSFVTCSTSGQIRLYERALSSLDDGTGIGKAGEWNAQDLLSHSHNCTDLVSSDSLVACASKSGRIIRWNL